MSTLLCPCCKTHQRFLYCSPCLQQGIATHHEAAVSYQKQTAIATSRARAILDGHPSSSSGTSRRGFTDWRKLRAEVSRREKSCDRLRVDIERRSDEICRTRQRLESGRRAMTTRRGNLGKARDESNSEQDVRHRLATIDDLQQQIAQRLIDARRVLVQEIVAIFGVKKRVSGDWEIAGLVLPSPDLFRIHPHSNINAAISHAIHLLLLITKYLSIDLPFIPTPPPPFERAHIGKPYMRANVPFVGTKKWRDKPVLWMSHSASIASKSRSNESILSTSRFLPSSRSALPGISKSNVKHRQFLTAYALLAHSVSYLAWTQGVPGIGFKDDNESNESDEEEDNETPFISRPGSRARQNITSSTVLYSPVSTLELLYTLTRSPILGERSHEPGTILARSLGFDLDVAKVVGMVLSLEEHRWGTKKDIEEIGDDWDLVETDKK